MVCQIKTSLDDKVYTCITGDATLNKKREKKKGTKEKKHLK